VNLFLLQNQAQSFREDNSVAGIAFLAVAGVIILVVFITTKIRNSRGMGKGMTKGNSLPRRFSIFSLYKINKIYGLNGDQSAILEYILKNNSVIDAEKTVANPQLLDKYFKQTYKQIEKSGASGDDIGQKMTLLFSTRNTIEMHHNTSPGQPPPQLLSTGTEAVLSANQESYQVKVISSQKNSVLVTCPSNSLGTKIRFARGTKARLAFFTKANKGFSINCQILETEDTSFGQALQLSRSLEAKAMTQRRFRRRQISLDCGYYPVHLEATKRKKPPKMTIESRRISGTITDLSIGGCAIKTQNSVPAGIRLKIEMESFSDSEPIAVLGQVLRINRSGLSYSVMHVRFLKVSQKAMNVINAMVFDYKDN